MEEELKRLKESGGNQAENIADVTVEESLRQCFQSNKIRTFVTGLYISKAWVDTFTDEHEKNDANCIKEIMSEDEIIFKSIWGIYARGFERGDLRITQAEYNVVVSRICNSERFVQSEDYDPARLERFIRMLYGIAGITISDTEKILKPKESVKVKNDNVLAEIGSAKEAYDDKDYRVAVEKSKTLFENGINTSVLGNAYLYGNGTNQDYNKALYHLSYPHIQSTPEEKEERKALELLLEKRDKARYASVICLFGSVVLFLFMLLTGFFSRYLWLAIVDSVLLILGCVFFAVIYKKKLIFDLSYWFLVLGCMFLSILLI